MKKLIFIFLIFVCKFSFGQTPVFTCGLECGLLFTAGSNIHFDAATGFSISTTTVRSGARSLRSNQAASGGSSAQNIQSSNVTKVWRIYIRFATLPDVDCIISWFDYSGSSAGIGYKTSDTKLYSAVEIASVNTFGSTGVTVTTGVWYRVDVKTVGDLVTGTSDIQVDGTVCGQATGAFVNTNATNGGFGSNGVNITADIYFDDYILSHTSADYPLGAGFVNHFVPVNPDGTHSGLTAADFQRTLTGTDILNSTTDSYLLLDDVPLETGASVDWINMVAPVASTYVENIFGPAPGISTPTTAPRAAEFIIGYHQAATGTGTMIVQLNDNGSTGTIYSASLAPGVTSVAYKRVHFIDPPSAATVWTLSGNGNFNNARIRFGPTATVDANPDQYLDCAMIEAEFAGDPPVASPRKNRLPIMGVGAAIKSENGIEKSYSYYDRENMVGILPKQLINTKKEK